MGKNVKYSSGGFGLLQDVHLVAPVAPERMTDTDRNDFLRAAFLIYSFGSRSESWVDDPIIFNVDYPHRIR